MNNKLISLLIINLHVISLILIRITKRKMKVHKKRTNRRWWVHPINVRRNQELKDYPDKFFKYTRMSLEVFNKLLIKITSFLEKNSRRESLSPEHRLAITLR
ncbi:hypothetical protein ALC57_17443 [Trachymyrmex cornetzi]|uniref:Nuclease HARBI1 n=1 Tax=Trachymyrmex cornetzi TaxID=471704 RepID=A0A151ITQ8_9HYME|nr:hypothetical protein ALC57_17443 [Trachymyrmex cornetzi]